MARSYAQFKVTIWADPDYKALTLAEQGLYFMLVSQPFITNCGVINYHLGRLAALASDQSIDTINEGLIALEKRDYIEIDEDTGELLVRSFVRHDGQLRVPNCYKSMMNDRLQVISDRLRNTIDRELMRAWREGVTDNIRRSIQWPELYDKDPEFWAYISEGTATRDRLPEAPVNGSANPTAKGSMKGLRNPSRRTQKKG